MAVGLYNFALYLPAPFAVMVLVQWKVILTLKRQVKVLTGRTGEYYLNKNLSFINTVLFFSKVRFFSNPRPYDNAISY